MPISPFILRQIYQFCQFLHLYLGRFTIFVNLSIYTLATLMESGCKPLMEGGCKPTFNGRPPPDEHKNLYDLYVLFSISPCQPQ